VRERTTSPRSQRWKRDSQIPTEADRFWNAEMCWAFVAGSVDALMVVEISGTAPRLQIIRWATGVPCKSRVHMRGEEDRCLGP
jgi:hypothetical protein